MSHTRQPHRLVSAQKVNVHLPSMLISRHGRIHSQLLPHGNGIPSVIADGKPEATTREGSRRVKVAAKVTTPVSSPRRLPIVMVRCVSSGSSVCKGVSAPRFVSGVVFSARQPRVASPAVEASVPVALRCISPAARLRRFVVALRCVKQSPRSVAVPSLRKLRRAAMAAKLQRRLTRLAPSSGRVPSCVSGSVEGRVGVGGVRDIASQLRALKH